MSHLAGSDDGGYTVYVPESSPDVQEVLDPGLYCHKRREAPSTERTASPVGTMSAAVLSEGRPPGLVLDPELESRDSREGPCPQDSWVAMGLPRQCGTSTGAVVTRDLGSNTSAGFSPSPLPLLAAPSICSTPRGTGSPGSVSLVIEAGLGV